MSNPVLSPPGSGGARRRNCFTPRGRPTGSDRFVSDHSTLVGGDVMDIVHECCAGLDVHKKTVVACVRRINPDGSVVSKVHTFGTMTADLLALADWLDAHVVHVAMESTGVYWKPVFHILEGRFDVMLVNAGRL